MVLEEASAIREEDIESYFSSTLTSLFLFTVFKFIVTVILNVLFLTNEELNEQT